MSKSHRWDLPGYVGKGARELKKEAIARARTQDWKLIASEPHWLPDNLLDDDDDDDDEDDNDDADPVKEFVIENVPLMVTKKYRKAKAEKKKAKKAKKAKKKKPWFYHEIRIYVPLDFMAYIKLANPRPYISLVIYDFEVDEYGEMFELGTIEAKVNVKRDTHEHMNYVLFECVHALEDEDEKDKDGDGDGVWARPNKGEVQFWYKLDFFGVLRGDSATTILPDAKPLLSTTHRLLVLKKPTGDAAVGVQAKGKQKENVKDEDQEKEEVEDDDDDDGCDECKRMGACEACDETGGCKDCRAEGEEIEVKIERKNEIEVKVERKDQGTQTEEGWFPPFTGVFGSGVTSFLEELKRSASVAGEAKRQKKGSASADMPMSPVDTPMSPVDMPMSPPDDTPINTPPSPSQAGHEGGEEVEMEDAVVEEKPKAEPEEEEL
ncbi:hypothetical protein F5Y17DRAFT_460979 [Xylariaceae sp. FL0594]|nr:hypothetical protein F5Y17DRAFT_460979 [Xylariaceae sp. FL0594]